MNYVIEGLDPDLFAPMFAAPSDELARNGVVAVVADDDDYPCRVSLRGAAKGDRLLLLNYEHQPASSPYRSAHAIYVAQGSNAKGVFRNEIPPVMRTRMLSIRGFDAQHMIIDADLIDGAHAEALIQRLLGHSESAYLHVHFAKRGCFAATVRHS
jgi:hypothetical protein